jgi:hypothetical protein
MCGYHTCNCSNFAQSAPICKQLVASCVSTSRPCGHQVWLIVRENIDFLEFSVISMPCQNNVLCISTIPSKTESGTTYTITWDDLCKAVCLVPTIVQCSDADCECCATVFELLRDPDLIKFVESARFREQQLQVDTVMYDTFVGWGNFAENSAF